MSCSWSVLATPPISANPGPLPPSLVATCDLPARRGPSLLPSFKPAPCSGRCVPLSLEALEELSLKSVPLFPCIKCICSSSEPWALLILFVLSTAGHGEVRAPCLVGAAPGIPVSCLGDPGFGVLAPSPLHWDSREPRGEPEHWVGAFILGKGEAGTTGEKSHRKPASVSQGVTGSHVSYTLHSLHTFLRVG